VLREDAAHNRVAGRIVTHVTNDPPVQRVDVAAHDCRAVRCETVADGGADTTACAGDQGYESVKVGHARKVPAPITDGTLDWRGRAMRTTPTSGLLERLAEQGHLIGSQWVQSEDAGVHPHVYAATGRIQAGVGLGGEGDIDCAVDAARQAQPGWAALAPGKRAAILFGLADLLDENREEAAELAALDSGAPVSVMNPGRYTASWVRYYAGWADKLPGDSWLDGRRRVEVRLEAYGVIAVLPPWNGSMMGMGQKCAPALAAGNTVVVKPPEIAPFGMLRFAELALAAGVPAGVINVVVGNGRAGEALVGHSGVDKVSFTGGVITARALMAAAAQNLTPLTLELGGKSPNIVFADADLDTAADMAAFGGTALLSGQGCALPTRTYVQEDVYEEVVKRILARLGSLRVGDPLDPGTVVGPVVTRSAMERILAVIDLAQLQGANLLTGGERMGGEMADGWFIAPTVFGDVDHDSDLARNEVFGPVQAVLRFKTEEEVLEKANDSQFGLAAYLHTTDASRTQRLVGGLEAGTVVVNGMGGISPSTPFGGYKRSGFGREGGRAGLEEMLRTKTVMVHGQ
jgi:aldehyde dehydrogenase (NAD+)